MAIPSSRSPFFSFRSPAVDPFPLVCVCLPPHQDLDPWVTAPLFEDECNSMDPIHAMVSGRPPFAATGSDGSSTGPRDCPSPSRGRPGDGPLDGLCESWEAGQETGGGGSGGGDVGADALAVTPADTASMQEFRQTYDVLVAESTQGRTMPQATRVGKLVSPNSVAAGLSASAPAITPSSPGLAQAAAAAAHGGTPPSVAYLVAQDAAAFSAEAASPGPPGSTSATPPPVPAKPASVTAAFLVTESVANAEPLALSGGANEAVAGAGAVAGADAGGTPPGTITSRDLLLEWLRREAEQGDEEAQFHLAQLFSPPRFEMKPECRECGEPFGVTRYRHHCRHCGGSFCHEHAWHEHPIPKLGLPTAQVGGENTSG